MPFNESSLIQHRQIRGQWANSQRKLVLECFSGENPHWTRTELIAVFVRKAAWARRTLRFGDAKKYDALTEKSAMASCVFHLKDHQVLRACGKRKCRVTGRMVEMVVLYATKEFQQQII
ncbi:hypothetical protein ACFL54_09640 [Planctomycetota bacterium]